MATPKIATGAEQPINRHAGSASYEAAEAELIGLDANGDLVMADADSAVAVPAIGVSFGPVDNAANYTAEIVKSVVDAHRTQPGDRLSFIDYGIEIENEDGDWTFTPGERVYLAEGGGYTQTAPTDIGDIVQVVGVALTAERIMLRISHDYEVVA